MINAGAILVSDVLVSHYSASKSALLSMVRGLCGSEAVCVDSRVHESNVNMALATLHLHT